MAFQLATKDVLVIEVASLATGAPGNVSTLIVGELTELPAALEARTR